MWKMPEITRRSSTRRAPGWFLGRWGSIAVQASSDNQNSAMRDLHQPRPVPLNQSAAPRAMGLCCSLAREERNVRGRAKRHRRQAPRPCRSRSRACESARPLRAVLDRLPPARCHCAGAGGRIYVGFAVQDGRAKTIAIEGSIAIGFAAAALAGLWVSAWAIPAAYALHGFWDLAHHRHVATAMPPGMCRSAPCSTGVRSRSRRSMGPALIEFGP